MDKIKALDRLIAVKKEVIELTTDEGALEKLNAELLELIEERAEAKAAAKFEAEAAEKKRTEEIEAAEKAVKVGTSTAKQYGSVKVTEAGEYRGVKIKSAIKQFKDKSSASVQKMIDSDYEATEKVTKMWIDMTLKAIQGPARVEKAMTEGTGTAGGYLVPSEERMEVYGYMREQSVALRRCQVVNMVSDTMTVPVENATVTAAFRSEGSAVTATSPTFTQATLSTKNLDAYTDASKELVQDEASMPSLVATLMSQFNESVAKKIDSASFIGTGDPVSGMFISRGYSQVFGTGSAAFSMLTFSDIVNIIGKVFATPQNTERLAFFGHPTPMWQYLRGLVDSNGQPIFGDPQGGRPGNLYGWPVENVYQAPSTSAASTAFLLFGDLTGFLIGERLTTMNLFYDPYTDAANGNDRFFLFTRWAFANVLNKKWGTIITAS